VQKYHVDITSIAESDIKEIFEYIARDSESAAIGWVEEMARQIHSLESFPLRCPVIPEAPELGSGDKYRHIIYGNYRTIFTIDAFRVIVMRVFHGARLLDLRPFEK
jgi:plasmid stabilization system protein ParE